MIISFVFIESKYHLPVIPITVRQLEAIIRMSESFAKMELSPFAHERHVEEALRLFHVSTIEAAATGNLIGYFLYRFFIYSAVCISFIFQVSKVLLRLKIKKPFSASNDN